ncbi:MAG: Cys-Gln thioester bond-forming surface protein [Clostridia bacterium]|nr:Cys-Gln thioester bond-forming surface protein [Clostridia bacterium]
MKKFKSLIFIIVSIAAVFQCLFSCKKVNAATIGDKSYLQRAEKGYYTIQKWNGSDWIYVTYSITNYVDENGTKRVAYCVNPDLKGIGYISGEFEGYNVELKELLSNQKAWRVLVNGYPYKTPADLGVEDEQDAYLATKMALYTILRNQTESDVRSLFRAGEDKVAGENLEDIQRKGKKVIDAICKLVNIGNNGKDTMQNNNLISIQKNGNFTSDSSNTKYYSQVFRISSKVECKEYTIKSIKDFPEGTLVTNINGKEQKTFKGGDEFKIMVPKTSIIGDIKGSISLSGICKNYPIYYAECAEGNYQNYVLCCDSYSKDIESKANVDIKVEKSKLKINKIDKDMGSPIEGVIFSIKYKDGEDIGTYKTDKKGMIYLNNLHQGQVIIKELATNNKYSLNTDDVILDIGYNDEKDVVIKNEIKKGSIKIIKVDANDNKIRIEGAKFEIYDENKNLIQVVVTDKNGEAKIENIQADCKYTIKEVETAKEYILSNDEVTIELKENEIKTLTFKNKKKTIEKLPRTGSVNISEYIFQIVSIGSVALIRIFLK